MSQTIGIGGVNFSWPGDLDHAARLDFIHAELQVKVAPYPDISWFEWPVIHGVRVRATAEYTSSRGDQAAWRRYHEENFNDEDDEDNEALFAASFVNPTDEDAEREEFEWLAAVAEREVGVQHADKQVRAISDMIFENKDKMTTMEFKEQMEFIGKTREAVVALSSHPALRDGVVPWKLEDVPNILKSWENAIKKNINLANLTSKLLIKIKQLKTRVN